MFCDILRAEAAVVHEIATCWQRLKGTAVEVGLLETFKMYQLHFACRDAGHEYLTRHTDNPRSSTLYVHMDFLQHDTLPIGPKEDGAWWYANARLSITLLVILVWGEQLHPTFYTYCSYCMEQTPGFVIACFMDLRARLNADVVFERFHVFCDVGRHFQASRFIGYILSLVPGSVREAEITFFPPGHGKGKCDGQGGRMEHTLNDLARRSVISTLEQYCNLLQKAADLESVQNPGAPKCLYIAFTPPAKTMIPKTFLDTVALATAGLAIQSTFQWSMSKVGLRPELFRHPLPGSPSDKSIRPVLHSGGKGEGKGNDDEKLNGPWKTAYRKQEPEKVGIKLGSLCRTWRSHAGADIDLSVRRRSWADKAPAFLRTKARKKSLYHIGKQARDRLNGVGIDSDSSSDTSSDSTSS
jgi:hypothetical protein